LITLKSSNFKSKNYFHYFILNIKILEKVSFYPLFINFSRFPRRKQKF